MKFIEQNGEHIAITENNRFSTYQFDDTEVLESWRKWFEERGINSVIEFVPGKGFALFRNGLVKEGR